jgi:hypothetical protein
MKKELGKAFVAIGTNISTLGIAGILFGGDSISVIDGTLASSIGIIIISIGIAIQCSKKVPSNEGD